MILAEKVPALFELPKLDIRRGAAVLGVSVSE
jgi:hypothetical protein